MGYESYAQLFNLEEISIIAGTEYTLNFTVYEEDGTTPVNLNASTIHWVLAYYGLDVAAVDLTVGSGITITGENTFRVIVPSASTINLQGKFIQQPRITDFNGSVFTPGQGIFTVLPCIQ